MKPPPTREESYMALSVLVDKARAEFPHWVILDVGPSSPDPRLLDDGRLKFMRLPFKPGHNANRNAWCFRTKLDADAFKAQYGGLYQPQPMGPQ